MSLPHFIVEDLSQDTITLSKEDARHALGSLRLRPGDRVSVADGDGSLAEGLLQQGPAGTVAVEVIERRRVVRRAPVVSVALAPPKGDRLAWAVQKLAELGVDEAVLVHTERSVRAWDGDRAERTVARLRAVAREAAMQSRQAFVMGVSRPVTLDEAVDAGGTPVVALWEGSTEPLSACLPDQTGGIRVVVGPEGGFSDREVEAMRRAGAILASLGSSVLRTETAAIVGAALVLARYGRLG